MNDWKKKITIGGILFLTAMNLSPAMAQKKAKLAPTPPMGWNSWNWFGKNDVNEKVVKEVIDAMVSEGLKDAGYTYVVVDGGWRDSVLTPEGYLKPNPVKFPGGMAALADYAHSKGLKFGLHTVPGLFDCGNDRVGGFENEEKHIRQFVDWGLDFVKVDRCKMDIVTKDGNRGWNAALLENTYQKWSKILANSGRDIVFSISAYRFLPWFPEWCNMARTTGDMPCKVNGKARFDKNNRKPLSIMQIADINNESAAFAGDGYWNDPDIMAIGKHGLTIDEQRTHFALWCIMSAPLFLGNDPRNMSKEEKEIILNKECIAVDQDPFEQGKRIVKEEAREIWVKNLSDGNKAVLMLNRGNVTLPMTLNFKEIGLEGHIRVRDLYAKSDLGSLNDSLQKQLEPHACIFLLFYK